MSIGRHHHRPPGGLIDGDPGQVGDFVVGQTEIVAVASREQDRFAAGLDDELDDRTGGGVVDRSVAVERSSKGPDWAF